MGLEFEVPVSIPAKPKISAAISYFMKQLASRKDEPIIFDDIQRQCKPRRTSLDLPYRNHLVDNFPRAPQI